MSREHTRTEIRNTPLLLQALLRKLERLECGSITLQLPDQSSVELHGETPGPHAVMELRRPWAFCRKILLRGDIGFAESYMAGDWDTAHLNDTLMFFAKNEHRFSDANGGTLLNRLAGRLLHAWRRNSLGGSRKNIAAHYDLGNSFYELWLDETMTYSCALFEGESESLSRAQARKYQRVLDKLALPAGSKILEIGCGWGGFASLAAERGYSVHGITLSHEQLAWAQRTAGQRGLNSQLQLELKDYRSLQGQYDGIVSIEMLEAVGEDYWPLYFDTVKRCLKPGARAVIQVISIDEAYFEGYRRDPDFIQRYIFPGGMLPTPTGLRHQARRAGLQLCAMDGFGHDYARTLLAWDERFISVRRDIERLGFDERFYRMWRYYLHYCAVGFSSQRIDLQQLVLENPR